MNKLNSKKNIIRDKLGKQVLRCFIENLIKHGYIDPRGKTKDEILAEVKKIISDWKGKEPLFITIDYKDSILRQARVF